MFDETIALTSEFSMTTKRDYSRLEPGLLDVFRLFLSLMLAIMLIGQVADYFLASVHEPFELSWQADIFRISWLTASLCYLSWPELQGRLRALYLPVALVMVALFMLIERGIYLQAILNEVAPEEFGGMMGVASTGWASFIVLLIPLVIVAWQYDFSKMLLFCFGLLIVDIIVVSFLLKPSDFFWWPAIAPSLARTAGMTLVGYIIIRLIDGQRAQRQAIAEANVKLRQYASTVEQLSISHERNRLARELHDTLAHTLSATSVQLEAVDAAWDSSPNQARQLLHKSLAQTRSGLTETRRALQALRASPLDDLGLGLAIRTLAQNTAQRMDIALTIEMPETDLVLASDIEQSIYRICQEALANVTKHAAAQQITVTLRETNQELIFEVADDGMGFELADVVENGHYGIAGMRERAQLINGELSVTSSPDDGTIVKLVVPIE